MKTKRNRKTDRWSPGTGISIIANLLLLLLLKWAPETRAQDFTYTINNGMIGIDKYTGSGGSVTIPSEIDGLPVTSIGDNAFYGCSSLTNVTISTSVTFIGGFAFSGCTSLANITIPVSVTNMGWRVFSGCTSLANVTIPNSVTAIGDGAFAGCIGLTSITIPNSITNIGGSWFAGGAFERCVSLTSMTIPNSVNNIGEYAFYGCTSLTSATIPNNLTSIGSCVFSGCNSLTGVTIPNSVTNIGDWAFSDCSSLTSIMIPSSVINIGNRAFGGCTSLSSAYFNGNAPIVDWYLFDFAITSVYYLPGTTGWGATLAGCPTALWRLPNPLILTTSPSLGLQTNGFGFTITGSSNLLVVVEACTNLINPAWSPMQTNTLTGGSFYFNDPQWANYHSRFYRLRSP